MKFLCERCGTRYSIADEKVRQKILKIRCKSCDNVITLRDTAVEAGESAPAATASISQVVTRPPVAPPAPVRTGVPALPAARLVAEPVEWHLAVDGQQTGPFSRSQLASKVVTQRADAEVYIWKDGLDGWKDPEQVPEIARAVQAVRSGRSLPPPPRPPAAPPPPRPLSSLAKGAGPVRSVSGRGGSGGPAVGAAVASLSDHVAGFDEGEATQVQPLSAALAADLARGDKLPEADARSADLEDDSDKTPVAHLSSVSSAAGLERANGLNGHGGLHGAMNGHHEAGRAPAEAAAHGHASPFFPPPVAADDADDGGPAARAPAPDQSMGAESGLSQVMGLGGRVSRNPALKYVALAAGVLILGAAVALAFSGAGGGGTAVTKRSGPAPSESATKRSPEEAEKAAAEEAQKWFAEGEGQGQEATEAHKVAHIGGGPDPRAVKRPAPGNKATGGSDPTAPPPLAPPPAGAQEGAPNAPEERKVDLGLSERRALVAKRAAAAPPIDQSAIRNVVTRKENQDAVKLCYNRVLRRTGSRTGGRIEVTVTIGISGRVKAVDLKSPATLDAVHDCLKTSINRWRFPAGGEDYETGFTLVLSGS